MKIDKKMMEVSGADRWRVFMQMSVCISLVTASSVTCTVAPKFNISNGIRFPFHSFNECTLMLHPPRFRSVQYSEFAAEVTGATRDVGVRHRRPNRWPIGRQLQMVQSKFNLEIWILNGWKKKKLELTTKNWLWFGNLDSDFEWLKKRLKLNTKNWFQFGNLDFEWLKRKFEIDHKNWFQFGNLDLDFEWLKKKFEIDHQNLVPNYQNWFWKSNQNPPKIGQKSTLNIPKKWQKLTAKNWLKITKNWFSKSLNIWLKILRKSISKSSQKLLQIGGEFQLKTIQKKLTKNWLKTVGTAAILKPIDSKPSDIFDTPQKMKETTGTLCIRHCLPPHRNRIGVRLDSRWDWLKIGLELEPDWH